MKKTLWLLFSLLTSILAIAQTQQGVVKTRGKMVNGVLQKGTPLSGATVQIKDRSAMVSGNDGTFSFPLRTNSYLLQNVKKNGYQLVDMEICRDHKYSADPLYIVMETPEQQRTDRLAAERKIRRNLQEQLRQKEDEIEALSISMEEKETRLQQLYQQQGDNERLIADMAQRYATLDYDQLDEFYRQVSCFIENGELSRADSLLRTRGDINTQVQDIIKQGQTIQEQKEQIKKAEAVHLSDIDEAAKRCYSYYESFLARHQNDSAAYYLELRATLDTTNVEWSLASGNFYLNYLADSQKALDIFKAALLQSVDIEGDKSLLGAKCFSCIANAYLQQEDFDEALDAISDALRMRIFLLGDTHPEVGETYAQAAFVGISMGLHKWYDIPMEYLEKALAIELPAYGEDHTKIADIYMGMAVILTERKEYDRALELFTKALTIYKTVENKEGESDNYFWLGILHYEKGDSKKAMNCFVLSLEKGKELYGENHPDVASNYSRIAKIYYDQSQYDKALNYLEKALSITVKVFGTQHPRAEKIKENIEFVRQFQ